MPIGSAEISLPPFGDFSLQPDGDLVISQDEYQNPQATSERLVRLILTNPRLFDGNGNPISVPDDVFNPTYGSGARADVGEMQGPALISSLGAQISLALAAEPSVVSIPAPIVTVTQIDSNTIYVSIVATTVAGETVVVPSLPLSLGS